MTWTVESVTIPVPSKCRIAKRANKEKMPVSGDYPAQTVDGVELTVVLEGAFLVIWQPCLQQLFHRFYCWLALKLLFQLMAYLMVNGCSMTSHPTVTTLHYGRTP